MTEFCSAFGLTEAGCQVAAWQLTGLIFALGFLTMGALQLLKDFLPLRWLFQEIWIYRWVLKRARAYQRAANEKPRRKLSARRRLANIVESTRKSFSRFFNDGRARRRRIMEFLRGIVSLITLRFLWGPDETSAPAWRQLVSLAVGGRPRVLFRLPSEQLVAQLAAASQMALEYPYTYADLVKVLSQGIAVGDIRTLLANAPDSPKVLAKLREARGGSDSTQPPDKTPPDIEPVVISADKLPPAPVYVPPPEYNDARNRVAHRMQRNLDAIHIAIASDWKYVMQGLALLLSVAASYYLVFQASEPGTQLIERNGDLVRVESYRIQILAVVVGISAGFLAPVFRDVLAALQGLRQR